MRPSGERGYALVLCVWLLALAGAVGSMLMLRSLEVAAAAIGDVNRLTSELAAEAAIETARADLLLNGERSRWYSLPARGIIQVGKESVTLALNADRPRPDINRVGERELVEALQAAGVPSANVGQILQRHQIMKMSSGYRSDTQLAALGSGLPIPVCITALFTVGGRALGGTQGAAALASMGAPLVVNASVGPSSISGRIILAPQAAAGWTRYRDARLPPCQ